MLSNIYGGMNIITNAIALTSDDNGRCEAVARNIKGFYFHWCVRSSALVCTVRKLKYRVRGLT